MSKILHRWNRKRVTTYLSNVHMSKLRSLSDEAGVPMGKIIDQALDNFFTEIGLQEQPTGPSIDLKLLREAILKKKRGTSGQE